MEHTSRALASRRPALAGRPPGARARLVLALHHSAAPRMEGSMAVSQQQAAAALQKAGVSVFGLQVEDTGASVSLRGTVGSEAEKRKAEQALRQATDTQVANYLEVQSGGDSASGGQSYTVKSGD